MGVFASKGLKNIAQGFNPGCTGFERRALKGQPIVSGSDHVRWIIGRILTITTSGAAFRAHLLRQPPRVKTLG